MCRKYSESCAGGALFACYTGSKWTDCSHLVQGKHTGLWLYSEIYLGSSNFCSLNLELLTFCRHSGKSFSEKGAPTAADQKKAEWNRLRHCQEGSQHAFASAADLRALPEAYPLSVFGRLLDR